MTAEPIIRGSAVSGWKSSWVWLAFLPVASFGLLAASATYLKHIKTYNFGVERGYLSSDADPGTFLSEESDLVGTLGHMAYALKGGSVFYGENEKLLTTATGRVPSTLLKPATADPASPMSILLQNSGSYRRLFRGNEFYSLWEFAPFSQVFADQRSVTTALKRHAEQHPSRYTITTLPRGINPEQRQASIEERSFARSNLTGYLWYVQAFILPAAKRAAEQLHYYEARRLAREAADGLSAFRFQNQLVGRETLNRVNGVLLLEVLLQRPDQNLIHHYDTLNAMTAINALMAGEYPDYLSSAGPPVYKRIVANAAAINAKAFSKVEWNGVDEERLTTAEKDLVRLLRLRAGFWKAWHACVSATGERTGCRAARREAEAEVARSREFDWSKQSFRRELEHYQSELAKWS